MQKKHMALMGAWLLALGACEAPSPDRAEEQKSTVEAAVSVRPEGMAPYQTRPITDDVMYFVLPDRFANGDPSNDRGGMDGDASVHGFDPTNKGFYHGGDLKGLTEKLDYLADMGISAVWLTPIFKNNAVQRNDVDVTAGYHGYWITDFTQIDPHLGTNADLKTLVEEAHKRNMKVIFDIITNHTADVIQYEECIAEADFHTASTLPICPYRPLSEPAYTPYIPKGWENVKVPAWLNDPEYYTKRGASTWEGESVITGDFAGLDDIDTSNPAVVQGFIDIYKSWITDYRIDGFRIDTVKHVHMDFWQEFSPAILDHAKAEGIENFYMFGEVYEFSPEKLSRFTKVGKLPAVLDFGFQNTAAAVITEGQSTRRLSDFFAEDHHYDTEASDASILPTFLGNHDMGRLGHFIQKNRPDAAPGETLRRAQLGYALMYFTRGVPVVYYGDEQGFTGDGNDRDAREDMFPSQTQSYNDNTLIGTEATTAGDNFNPGHPLYKSFQRFAAIKRRVPALRGGAQALVLDDDRAGVFGVIRSDEATGTRALFLLNSATEKRRTETALALKDAVGLCLVDGDGVAASLTSGRLTLDMEPLSWAVFNLSACGDKPGKPD